MFISTHMYYSKTFIPGQFSPDYWEASTIDVLGSFTVGKIIGSRPVQPTVTMKRTTSTLIADLDELSLGKANLQSRRIQVAELPITTLDSVTVEGKAISVSEAMFVGFHTSNLDTEGITVTENTESEMFVSESFVTSLLSTLEAVPSVVLVSTEISTHNVNVFENTVTTVNTKDKVTSGIVTLDNGSATFIQDGYLYTLSEPNLTLAEKPATGTIGNLEYTNEQQFVTVQLRTNAQNTINFTKAPEVVPSSMTIQIVSTGSSLAGTHAGAIEGEYNSMKFAETSSPLGPTPFTNP